MGFNWAFKGLNNICFDQKLVIFRRFKTKALKKTRCKMQMNFVRLQLSDNQSLIFNVVSNEYKHFRVLFTNSFIKLVPNEIQIKIFPLYVIY